jgi:outer membrane lipoprotein-sorting protein
MKKVFIILTAALFVLAGCVDGDNDPKRPGTVANIQSQVNQIQTVVKDKATCVSANFGSPQVIDCITH